MKKVVLLSAFLVVLLVGCTGTKVSSNKLTFEDVQTALQTADLSWDRNEDELAGGIFSFPLNSVNPVTLSNEGDILTVYIYDSDKERKEAVEQFENGTEKMQLVDFKMYEEGNCLLFYVYYDESEYKESVHESIEKALKDL